jgi:hypothetical protein
VTHLVPLQQSHPFISNCFGCCGLALIFVFQKFERIFGSFGSAPGFKSTNSSILFRQASFKLLNLNILEAMFLTTINELLSGTYAFAAWMSASG